MPKPSSSSLAVELTPQAVSARILTLRGVQVLFDRDLAQFFEIQPIRLREQVTRNIARFPADFMFQLTPDEVAAMVSQNAIPSKQQLGGYMPYAFTEEGVAALTKKMGELGVGPTRGAAAPKRNRAAPPAAAETPSAPVAHVARRTRSSSKRV